MKLRRSLLAALGQRYLTLLLTVAVTVVSARLLGPADFGEFAIAHAVILSFGRVTEAGMGAYLVQKTRLRSYHVQAAFGISLTAALLSAIAVLASRHWIGRAFEGPRIDDLLLILTVLLLFAPFNTVKTGLLLRRMNFVRLMICGLLGTLALTLTTLFLLALGAGVYALAWGAAAESLALMLALNLVGGRVRWLAPAFRNWGSALRVGAPVTGANFVRELGEIAPQLIVGRGINVEATGVLNRANVIANLFYRTVVRGLAPVFTPAFANQVRRRQQMSESWMKALAMLVGVAWPVLLFLAVQAEAVVYVLFGPDWAFIATYVALLCIGALGLPVSALTTELLVALGQARAQFMATVAAYSLRVAVVLALALWTRELYPVVLGLAIAQFAEVGFLAAAGRRATDLRVTSLLGRLLPSAALSLMAILPAIAVRLTMAPDLAGLAVASVLTATAWLVALRLFRHPLWPEVAHAATRFLNVSRAALNASHRTR